MEEPVQWRSLWLRLSCGGGACLWRSLPVGGLACGGTCLWRSLPVEEPACGKSLPVEEPACEGACVWGSLLASSLYSLACTMVVCPVVLSCSTVLYTGQ